MGTSFEVTAVWYGDENKYYNHFGIHPSTAPIYGDAVEDIETIVIGN